MEQIALGIFMVLHGLVHLLYLGQSARLFELQPGMGWPDGSWASAKLIGNEATRVVASVSLVLASMGYIGGGIGIFMRQIWWRPVIVGTAAFSAVLYILFWNGRRQNLANQGGIGLIINLAILVMLLVFGVPSTGL